MYFFCTFRIKYLVQLNPKRPHEEPLHVIVKKKKKTGLYNYTPPTQSVVINFILQNVQKSTMKMFKPERCLQLKATWDSPFIIDSKACADQFRGSLSQSVRLDMLWSNWGYREFNWMEQPQARGHTINCLISELLLHAGSILTMFSG